MTPLLRKDLSWLLGLGIAGFIIGVVAMCDTGAALWYRPHGGFGKGALAFHWVASGLLGLIAALMEDANRTREYLRHRPVSPGRLFWTKHLAGLGVVAGWIFLPPPLHLAGTLLFHPSSHLVEANRVWGFIHAGAVGPAFYAVAVFGATVTRRTLLGIVVAFGLSLAVALFFGLGLFGDSERVSRVLLAGLVPISLALTIPLLLAAAGFEREGRDLDLPVTRARLTAVACGLVMICLAGSVFLHAVQLDLRREIARTYPKLGRLPDGTPVLVAFKDWKPAFRVDDQHRRIPGSVADVEIVLEPRSGTPTPKPDEPLASRGALMAGVRYQRVYCGGPRYCYVGSDGLAHFYGWEGDGGPADVAHVGKEGGGRFSPRSRVLGNWSRTALMVDRADGTLWRLDLHRPGQAFTRVALPGDDRYVEDLSAAVARETIGDMFAPEFLVVRGERGVYMAERSGFVPVPPEIAQAVERVDRQERRPRAQLALTSAVHGTVTMPASGTEPAFSHQYAPRTLLERTMQAGMLGLSLLRPPVLVAASLFSPQERITFGNATDDDQRIVLDPMVMLRATGVLPFCLLLGASLAVLTFRRLGRLGVPAPRRAFWTAAVFLLGVLAYLVQRACENTRAWRPLEETAKPPLLIKSAA